MPKKTVIALSGSPSATSKSALLADYVLEKLASDDISVEHIRLASLDPEALIMAKWDDPCIIDYSQKVAAAHGVVIATPIYKASCSGLMKIGLDLLPQFGLAGKTVLPLGTGGSIAHVLALDYGLRPILQSMGARHVVQSHFVCESDIIQDDGFDLSPMATTPLNEAIKNFLYSLSAAEDTRLLGHPRPNA
ncbi:NADPH-dependent FMN reductase [Actibacterium sp. D379-3]